MSTRAPAITMGGIGLLAAALAACAAPDPGTAARSIQSLGMAGYGGLETQADDEEAGSDDGPVVLEQGTVVTLAGIGASMYRDDTGIRAGFSYPMGVAADAEGTMYVGDTGNNLIRRVTDGGVVTTWAGIPYGGARNGPRAQASFRSPMGLCFTSYGALVVADAGNHMIRAIQTDGQVVTLAGDGLAGYVDGQGAIARFCSPRAVAVDRDDNVYVADSLNHTIRRIEPDGWVSTVAGAGASGYKDGAWDQARFNEPWGLDVDDAGIIYVADTGNHRIRAIDLDGNVTTLAGGLDRFRDGLGSEAGFGYPAGLVVEKNISDPYLYVSDLSHACIRRITLAGQTITYAGRLYPGRADGTGREALFNAPHGLALLPNFALAVVDTNNQTVRRIDPP